MLGLKPERAICTPTSGYVFVVQLRDEVPKPIGNLLWLAYGPADTSCFTPLHAGVTNLPDLWDRPANFTRIDRQQPQWNFRLVHNLAQRLPYQKAIKEVQAMIKPAERRCLDFQHQLEQTAVDRFRKQGPKAAEEYLTAYASDCARKAGLAYSELVDFLMFQFLAGAREYARPSPPRMAAPAAVAERDAPGH
jgi:dipeptidase